MHREKHFLSELKKSKVVPLPKSKNKTNPTSLSVLSKRLEKRVHIHLNYCLEKHQLIHPFQSLFRRKYSCNIFLHAL